MSLRSRYPLTYRFRQRESQPMRVLFRALVVLGVFFSLGTAWVIYRDLTMALPPVEQLAQYLPPATTRIYADDGASVIGEFSLEKRYPLRLDQIPSLVQQAFLAAEDADFYDHPGIDLLGMARALLANWQAGRRSQGGSTITQQVVKYLLLSPEKSYRRKLQEILLSLRLERHLSKRQIFELYLNHIYLGSGAYGVEAAAREYFGKSVTDLSLAEITLIAGLPPAPSRYSPRKNWEGAKARQRYVLERLLDERIISYKEMLEAWPAPTPLTTTGTQPGSITAAPYYVEHVRQLLQQRYGGQMAHQLGFRVHTAVNLALQRAAEHAIREGIDALCARQHCGQAHAPRPSGALIAIELRTGQVKALVGGENFQHSQFNRATQAKRQPGSVFKPFVYAAALESPQRFSFASMLDDSPVSFTGGGRTWSPQNYERRYFGPTRLREALTFSRNVVTVKLAQHLGLDYLIPYVTKFGLPGKMPRHLSIVLGSSELTLEELTRAYGVFASGGYYFEPLYMTAILDNTGRALDSFAHLGAPVLSPEYAYLLTSVLQDVIERGTGKAASALGRPAAGKTGTTDDFRDAWFIGYTPELLVGVWVGHDDRQSLGEKETGGRAAAPIWLSFMRAALGEQPVADFDLPKGLVPVPINPRTGRRAQPGSSSYILEYFPRGTEPATVFTEEPDTAPSPSNTDFQSAEDGF